MTSPFRVVAKEMSKVAGDALYAAVSSGGRPDKLVAGQLRVALDNLEVGPKLIKTTLLGNMQETINRIVGNAPKVNKKGKSDD